MTDQTSSEPRVRGKPKGLKPDELDVFIQAYQKERWDAETAKIARLKALRLSRDAQARAPQANQPDPKDKPTGRKRRPARYLGGYE